MTEEHLRWVHLHPHKVFDKSRRVWEFVRELPYTPDPSPKNVDDVAEGPVYGWYFERMGDFYSTGV